MTSHLRHYWRWLTSREYRWLHTVLGTALETPEDPAVTEAIRQDIKECAAESKRIIAALDGLETLPDHCRTTTKAENPLQGPKTSPPKTTSHWDPDWGSEGLD